MFFYLLELGGSKYKQYANMRPLRMGESFFVLFLICWFLVKGTFKFEWAFCLLPWEEVKDKIYYVNGIFWKGQRQTDRPHCGSHESYTS